MSIYELPKEMPKLKIPKFWRSKAFWLAFLVIFSSSAFGFLAGLVSGGYSYLGLQDYFSKLNIELPGGSGQATEIGYIPQTSQEQATIRTVKDISPAVVSIVITKDVPIFEEYYVNPFQDFESFFGQPFQFQVPQYRQMGTEKQEVGGGTGFIISDDGMVLTNKHVVLDGEADYTVFTNEGKKYPAEVLARDPIQDLAVLKINQDKIVNAEGGLSLQPFPVAKLGDSEKLQMGQTVIAIGNAMGEFRNTVSIGVVSGLGRTITASGGSFVETIEDVIQTDAAINKGNSGGPLLNLRGEVIGINIAMVQDAQSIGFALPVNKAKKAIEQVKSLGRIVYPFVGIRYIGVTESIQKENSLQVDYGALIVRGSGGEPAISPDSPAQEAGLKENDIILEFNGEKITQERTLGKILQDYSPGDSVNLKVLRGGEEKIFQIVLGEREE